MIVFTVSLPWPDPKLSPNARLHFRKKSAHIHAARSVGFCMARDNEVFQNGRINWTGPLETKLIFQPPNKRRRDVDNLLASCKAYLDGIFEALGVDDSRVKRTVLEMGDPVLFGMITVEIRMI